MKCQTCNNELNVNVKLKFCPFCGETLPEEREEWTETDIPGVIRMVIAEKGIEILNEPYGQGMTAYVADFVRGYETEKKLFNIV